MSKVFYGLYTKEVGKYILTNIPVQIRKEVQDCILKQFGHFMHNVKNATSALSLERDEVIK